jgi:hypothetical protein
MQRPKTIRVGLKDKARHFERVGAEATRRAQQESRRRGVPNVYSWRGRLVFEHPHSGRLLEWDPAAPRTGRAVGVITRSFRQAGRHLLVFLRALRFE